MFLLRWFSLQLVPKQNTDLWGDRGWDQFNFLASTAFGKKYKVQLDRGAEVNHL